jgi:hypothetical protein
MQSRIPQTYESLLGFVRFLLGYFPPENSPEERIRYSKHGERLKSKINLVCHIMSRNYLLKHVTEGKLEGRIAVTRRRRRRCNHILDDFEEKYFWNLKLHALDHTLESFWKRLWICRKTNCVMNE